MMEDQSPITVIGSGPAGAAVARALIEARVAVHMLDAGEAPLKRPSADRPSLAALRSGTAGAAGYLLGDGLDGLRDMREYSPKLRTAIGADLISGFASANRIVPDGFNLVGALAQGGLSNIWGAVVSVFDERDMRGFPIAHQDLLPHYEETAKLMGISGVATDDDMANFHGIGLTLQPPLSLSPAVQIVMDNYKQRKHGTEFQLGRSRNAVLTQSRDTRGACTEDMVCMWGCSRGAIYNSADDVATLTNAPGFRYQGGTLVQRVSRHGDGYCIHAVDANGNETRIQSHTVILAAGTLASTRLVLDYLGKIDTSFQLLNTPAVALALWVPARLGKPLPAVGYGMAQASFRLEIPGSSDSYALGLLYAGETIGAPDLIAHMPVTRRGGIKIMRSMLSGLLIGLVYFPGEFSRNQVILRRDPDGNSSLMVKGGFDPRFQQTAIATIRRIASQFRVIGAWMLPGSAKPYPPGAEVHYGGTLPMGAITTANCEVKGAKGLFVVDGSALPRLPAKHLTFTIMANARRVGKCIADQFGR